MAMTKEQFQTNLNNFDELFELHLPDPIIFSNRYSSADYDKSLEVLHLVQGKVADAVNNGLGLNEQQILATVEIINGINRILNINYIARADMQQDELERALDDVLYRMRDEENKKKILRELNDKSKFNQTFLNDLISYQYAQLKYDPLERAAALIAGNYIDKLFATFGIEMPDVQIQQRPVLGPNGMPYM